MASGGKVDEHYAESVAIGGLSEDTAFAFSVRLGRFPPLARGTLWLSAFVEGRNYAVTLADLMLSAHGVTRIDEGEVSFEVAGAAASRFQSRARHTRGMRGLANATALAHESSDPDSGSGSVPVQLDASFEVSHLPAQVRPGRMEVMGRVEGTLHIADRAFPFEIPGKWHEQVGARPRFAPAFTYLFVQGRGTGIMATKHAVGAWGYFLEDGETIPVSAMEIEPYGDSPRRLTVALEDGRRIRGAAHIQRETSVAIEGKRRPSATVIVDTDVGRMAGELNDWDPGR